MKNTKQLLCMLLFFSAGNLYAQNWTVGGNALGAPGSFGSTSNERINFISNNIERGRLTANGRWGFGNSNPAARVHINSAASLNPLQVDVANTAALIVTGADSRVGMGTIAPLAKLHINSAAGEDGLRVQIAGATKLWVNNNGGVAVGASTTPPSNGLFVSGNAGIGTSTPSVKLQILGGNDASLGGGGYIVAGTTSSTNLVIDDNEIMARNDGVANTLFLNAQGGTVQTGANVIVGGTLDVAGSVVSFGSIEALSDAGNNTIGSNSNFVPTSDDAWSLGSSTARWEDVWAADGSINTSDLRDKTNVKELDYGLKEIMKLRSVRFNWKNSPAKGEKLGLIAQDLQKVLPEVVRDWEYKVNETTGQKEKVPAVRLGVMYADIIPVLIRGIQEQQKTITTLEDRIAKLESMLSNSSSANTSNAVATSKDISAASLEQNQPNPFNQSTTIRYKVPQGVNAQIIIYDASGNLAKTLQATPGGQTQINAYDLKAGVYTYNLVINGKLAASKKMVLAK